MINPEQAMKISRITLGDPDFAVDSFFDVFFEIEIPDPSVIIMSQPLDGDADDW